MRSWRHFAGSSPCRWRRMTSGSRRPSPHDKAAEPTRTRGRQPTSSRATSSTRVGDEVRTRARRRRGTRDRRGRLHARRGASCGRDDAAARAATNHLPGGVHAARHGRPRGRGARDRDREARGHAAADEGGLPAGERRRRASARVPEGLEAELDRGLPLPRDVRVHEAHLVGAPRRRTSCGLSGGTGARSTCAMRARRT